MAAVRCHPYLAILPSLGIGIPKNLASIDDWTIVRAVLRWKTTLKRDVAHKDSLLYAFSKVPQVFPSKITDTKVDTSVLSIKCNLLARIANAVDVFYQDSESSMATAQIDQLITEFQFQYAPSSGLGRYSFRAFGNERSNGNGNSGLQKFDNKVCFKYNDNEKCKRGEKCRFQHYCQQCWEISGERLSHPKSSCKHGQKSNE